MDDLKLFAKFVKELDNLIPDVRKFPEDIRMEFGLDKYATVDFKKGKIWESDGTTLPLDYALFPVLFVLYMDWRVKRNQDDEYIDVGDARTRRYMEKQWSEGKVTFLGVMFTYDGKWEEKINRRIEMISGILRELARTVMTKAKLSLKNKRSMFKSIFVPCLSTIVSLGP
ncbi:unnamed protein product [Soboliphyme baturini]|uniref:DUF772 domain-containing protein n=1 Tax=Soboliphyme baturini TaxID=241478 RepID=A0A183IR61_9BILA|nr:unnamed protein product [Soboliphyme baturini]